MWVKLPKTIACVAKVVKTFGGLGNASESLDDFRYEVLRYEVLHYVAIGWPNFAIRNSSRMGYTPNLSREGEQPRFQCLERSRFAC